MADSNRLIHLLPLPHLAVGAAVVAGEDTEVEVDVGADILEGGGTEAVVAEVEIDSLSLRRVVEKGDISPSRMVAGMTTAVQEEAAAVDMVAIVVVVSRISPKIFYRPSFDPDLQPYYISQSSGTNVLKARAMEEVDMVEVDTEEGGMEAAALPVGMR